MTKKTTRISPGNLSTVAAQGLLRAMQTRAAVGVDLTAAELAEVNGGVAFNPAAVRGVIAGGPWLPVLSDMQCAGPNGAGSVLTATGGALAQQG